MNLPVDATEFLDVFRGFLRKATNKTAWTVNNLPIIHCYGFVKGEDTE
jgi:hypothetical protein